MSKVVVLKCTDYEVDNVYQKISEGIALLGGLQQIVKKTDKVLLKPNLVSAVHPDGAATTHPAIFEAVSKLFIENGYTISYGDSPGFGSPEKVAKKAGLKDIADKYSIAFSDFSNGKQVSMPDNIICKQFEIVNAVFENDSIINLAKMKSHALQRITGAIKNPFGVVLGFNKGLMHSRYTNAYNFAEMIIDLNKYLNIPLHILDGVVAMEGNGPRNGDPVKMNVILLSQDPVALDTVFCKLVDVKPEIIPLITYGQKYGLGSYENIELLGDDIEPLINKTFNIDRTVIENQDSTSLSFLRKYVIRKPIITKATCKKCGVCVEVCPVEGKAVNFKDNDKTNPPVYNYKKCIRCYCCQEMCPYHSIEAKTPIIGKVLYGLKIVK